MTDERRVEHIPVESLRAAGCNPRAHSKRQVGQLAASMKRFGFTNPVLVDDENAIIAGHGRVDAARELGLTSVPCLRLSGMSLSERRAYLIADNKLALNSTWDFEVLTSELEALLEDDVDIALTGFDQPEIELLMSEAAEAPTVRAAPEDQHPALPWVPITRDGDLWLCGRHRIACGDVKDPATLDRLMDGGKASMIFTDPPYNVPIDGHVSGRGRIRHREFAEASGEMSSAQFEQFLRAAFASLERACRNGAIAFVRMDWRHMGEVLAAGSGVFTDLKNICVWTKTNAGMGTFYRSQHEMVLAWKIGDAPHVNNFGLGDKGRYRTNVWSYAGVNAFGADRLEELASHPTVKPVALVADAIRDVSDRGDIVLDGFGGSGTTLIAAQKRIEPRG